MTTNSEQAASFARDGYIVLENIFNEEELDLAFKEVLIKATGNWNFVTYPYKKSNGEYHYDSLHTPLLPERHADSIKRLGEAVEAAKSSTKMCYAFVRTSNNEIEKPFRDLMVGKFPFISNIVGEPINSFYATFTSCYEQGCFLTPHTDDFKIDSPPTIAFVLNVSRDWRWEWGGILHILDKSPWDNGEVIKTIKPTYNSLVLFKLPKWHYVSEVATCAPTKRLAFSGWLKP